MKLRARALGLAIGTVWGVGMLLTAIVSLLIGSGITIRLFAPFFYGFGRSIGGAFAGLIWGFVYGFIAGALIAWLYNMFFKMLYKSQSSAA
jgi:hypothetical protein